MLCRIHIEEGLCTKLPRGIKKKQQLSVQPFYLFIDFNILPSPVNKINMKQRSSGALHHSRQEGAGDGVSECQRIVPGTQSLGAAPPPKDPLPVLDGAGSVGPADQVLLPVSHPLTNLRCRVDRAGFRTRPGPVCSPADSDS